MVRKLVCLCLAATSFALASVTAGEVASHKERMDTAEDLKADLKDALEAGSAAKAGRSADELTKVLQQEEQYWIKTKLDDAIELAKTNLSDATQIAADAKAGKIDDAKIVYKQLEKTCTDCHSLHPEQRVKPE